MNMGEKILGRELAIALQDFRSPQYWPDLEAIERTLRNWQGEGVQIERVGQSREGRDIKAAVLPLGPNPTHTMLAWGYPHPDEPIGAAALAELGEAALRNRLRALQDWKLVLILCADPDNVNRQLWLRGDGSARDWARGVWHPNHLGLEVDYGFPLQWGPFYQPASYQGRCHSEEECRARCGGPPCKREALPWGPLPESLALANAIQRWQPEIVAAMHSHHTSGDYTFLLERESPEVLDDMLQLPSAMGSLRHRGEAIDRGRAWKRGASDLLREDTLEAHRARIERRDDYRPGARYRGNASAAHYIEALPWQAQFICPETALFRSPLFADENITAEMVELQTGTEKRRKGLSRVTRFWHDGRWVRAYQIRDLTQYDTKKQLEPSPRAVYGVRALLRRRQALARADEIWDSLQPLPSSDHLYREEHARTSVPGAFVGDRSMLIFRARADYRKPATRAQEYSFRWIWPMHTASLLGNLVSGLRHEDPENPTVRAALRRAEALQDLELAEVSEELLQEADRKVSMTSQVARVFRLMLERS